MWPERRRTRSIWRAGLRSIENAREIFGIRDLAMQQVSSLMRGLAELRSEGRASPDLIHSKDMYTELVQVRAKAHEQGMSFLWRKTI